MIQRYNDTTIHLCYYTKKNENYNSDAWQTVYASEKIILYSKVNSKVIGVWICLICFKFFPLKNFLDLFGYTTRVTTNHLQKNFIAHFPTFYSTLCPLIPLMWPRMHLHLLQQELRPLDVEQLFFFQSKSHPKE